ncbi:MAG: carboxypeptidase-like regulatory domain-containing protein [Chitinophagales bacterium]
MSLPFIVRASDGRAEPCLLQGYVKDAVTKKPVQGVLVSVTSPGSTLPKEVVTDADGFFHFSDLPFSQINLQFGKKGYQLYKRTNVVIKEKATVKINVDFIREDMSAEPDANTDDSEYPLLRMLET